MGKKFWQNGISFLCRQCSHCCRHEPGFVFLYEKDLPVILKKLNINAESFIKKYCRWVELSDGYEYLSLMETKSYDCIFWNEGCSIYEVRPLQCRTFPFWTNALSSLNAWDIMTAGCKAKIKIHSKEQVSERRENGQNIAKKTDYPCSISAGSNCKNDNLQVGRSPKQSFSKKSPYNAKDASFFSYDRIAEIIDEQLTSKKIKRVGGKK